MAPGVLVSVSDLPQARQRSQLSVLSGCRWCRWLRADKEVLVDFPYVSLNFLCLVTLNSHGERKWEKEKMDSERVRIRSKGEARRLAKEGCHHKENIHTDPRKVFLAER